MAATAATLRKALRRFSAAEIAARSEVSVRTLHRWRVDPASVSSDARRRIGGVVSKAATAIDTEALSHNVGRVQVALKALSIDLATLRGDGKVVPLIPLTPLTKAVEGGVDVVGIINSAADLLAKAAESGDPTTIRLAAISATEMIAGLAHAVLNAEVSQ